MMFDDLIRQTQANLLSEAPYCYENAVFKIQLNDDSVNKTKLDFIYSNDFVLKSSFKNHFVYFGYDEEINTNTYYFVKDNTVQALVGITVENNNNYCKAIAKRDVSVNKTIMSDIFFDYLPTIYDDVITDKMNNPLSKKFWKKLLKASIEKGLKVVVFNDRNKEETPFTFDDFEYFWQPKLNKIKLLCAQEYMTFKIYFK